MGEDGGVHMGLSVLEDWSARKRHQWERSGLRREFCGSWSSRPRHGGPGTQSLEPGKTQGDLPLVSIGPKSRHRERSPLGRRGKEPPRERGKAPLAGEVRPAPEAGKSRHKKGLS